MYEQVASQHDKIDDFRGKLLAVLPAITGLSLFGLGKTDMNCALFPAIGIVGVFASVGLFVHELRGITECYRLIGNGFKLERKLATPEDDYGQCGPFSTKYLRGFNGIVSRETAAILVYPATIAAWALVATANWSCAASSSNPPSTPTVMLNSWRDAVAPVLVFLGAALISEGYLVWNSYEVTGCSRIVAACSGIAAGTRSFFQKIKSSLGSRTPAHSKH
jgi:hypothetical protein